MKHHEIQSALMKAFPLQEVYISGDRYHLHIIAISDKFGDMSRIEKHRAIYLPLMQYITSQQIHAVSIKTYTKEEWENDRVLNSM